MELLRLKLTNQTGRMDCTIHSSKTSTVCDFGIIKTAISKSVKTNNFYTPLRIYEISIILFSEGTLQLLQFLVFKIIQKLLFILELLRTCRCFFNNINVYFYRNICKNEYRLVSKGEHEYLFSSSF